MQILHQEGNEAYEHVHTMLCTKCSTVYSVKREQLKEVTKHGLTLKFVVCTICQEKIYLLHGSDKFAKDFLKSMKETSD